MTTSGLIIVRDDDNRPLVAIRQHGDGYPSGLGYDLAKTFGETRIINGIKKDAIHISYANGMNCLAAQIVWVMKSRVRDQIGGIYLVSTKEDWHGLCNWTYILTKNKEDQLDVKVYCGSALTYSGSLKDLDLEDCQDPNLTGG